MYTVEPIRHTDPRLKHCGFAKLQGDDGQDYYIKKYEIFLGRRSKSTDLDIVLGDNMNISRKHAKISFNFEKGVFELVVMGKNGVTVQGVLYTPTSDPLALQSRDYMQIGDRSFYFLLPKFKNKAQGGPPSKRPKISKPNGSMLPAQAETGVPDQGPAHPQQQYSNAHFEPAFRGEEGKPLLQHQAQAQERVEAGHQGPYQQPTAGGSEYYDDEEYDDAEENFAADETGQYEGAEEDGDEDDDLQDEPGPAYYQNYNQHPGV